MDEEIEKLFRDIKELKQFLNARQAKELPGCLGCLLQILVGTATTVIAFRIRILDSHPVIYIIVALAFIILALLATGYLLSRPAARTHAILVTRASELGYEIRHSRRGRRYAVPVDEALKQALLHCAFMQNYCLIYCRSCGRYIEPCDLVQQCLLCSQWFHADCVDENDNCVYCRTGVAVPAKKEKYFVENEDRSVFFEAPGSCSDVYPPYGIALESADSVEMDEFFAAKCGDFR